MTVVTDDDDQDLVRFDKKLLVLIVIIELLNGKVYITGSVTLIRLNQSMV